MWTMLAVTTVEGRLPERMALRAQGGIDRGWFRHPRSTKDGKAHLPSILSIAADIASAMTYLHSVSRACAGELSLHAMSSA